MADPTITGAILGSGGILVAAGRELWSWFRKRTDEGSDAKDKAILTLEKSVSALESSLSHERLERAREHRESKEDETRMQRKLDAMEATLDRERMQAAGTLSRMRMDSTVDEAEFEETLPTAVRNMADLVAPKESARPPGIPDKRKLPPGAGRQSYQGLQLEEITPTEVPRPGAKMPPKR